MIPVSGVTQLTLATEEAMEGLCVFDNAPLIGKTFILSSDTWEMYLHDTCFFHMIFTIRQYFDQNGVEIPEILRGENTSRN